MDNRPTEYEIRKTALECASRLLNIHAVGTSFNPDIGRVIRVSDELEKYLREKLNVKSDGQ